MKLLISLIALCIIIAGCATVTHEIGHGTEVQWGTQILPECDPDSPMYNNALCIQNSGLHQNMGEHR